MLLTKILVKITQKYYWQRYLQRLFVKITNKYYMQILPAKITCKWLLDQRLQYFVPTSVKSSRKQELFFPSPAWKEATVSSRKKFRQAARHQHWQRNT